MERNIERRKHAVEQHPSVERADLDYDDGEVVVIALAEKVGEDFEDFVEAHDLSIRSGPKDVVLGIQVILA